MSGKSKPDIFRYHDYRQYLKDWFAFCKADQSSLSLRKVAEKAGMSVSGLSMVLSGSRSLSGKMLGRLAPSLGLHRRESDFLEILILLGNAKNQGERVTAFERLNEFRVYRNRNEKEAEVFRYLRHWYYVAIREMASLPGFKADPAWIRPRLQFQVSSSEIESALKFLIQHRYLELMPDGTVCPPSKALDCLGGVYKMALSQFHHEMLALAGRSIERVPPEKRNLLGYTLVVNAEKFAKVQHLLSQVYDEIRSVGQEGNEGGADEAVYHLELAFFPLTKV